MNIVIGTDHRGYEHKEYIKRGMHTCAGMQLEWTDVGAFNAQRSDYPEFAHKACTLLLQGNVERAVLLCGSGVGMAIAANRYKGIYAALVWNEDVAALSAQDDNANVLVLPADFITPEQAVAFITAWLSTPFKGGRYQKRIDQLEKES